MERPFGRDLRNGIRRKRFTDSEMFGCRPPRPICAPITGSEPAQIAFRIFARSLIHTTSAARAGFLRLQQHLPRVPASPAPRLRASAPSVPWCFSLGQIDPRKAHECKRLERLECAYHGNQSNITLCRHINRSSFHRKRGVRRPDSHSSGTGRLDCIFVIDRRFGRRRSQRRRQPRWPRTWP